MCMNAMGENPEENTDNASILLKMENGSTGVINYFSNGSKAYSKERVEVFHRSVRLSWIISQNGSFGVKVLKMKTAMDKGQKPIPSAGKSRTGGGDALILR